MIKHLVIFYSLHALAFANESDFMKAYQEQHSRESETPEQIIEHHSEGAQRVAREQDELSADVQELIQLETDEKVIQFLAEAEELMAGATDKLEAQDTSGPTIAIETEIIEKIADAAQQKQQSQPQQGEGDPQSGALMQMLQQMMQQGQNQEGQKPSQQAEGQQPGSQGGEGMEADSSSANTQQGGDVSGVSETRRLPKKSGSAGTSIPKEFQKALEAYNKGIETK
ncbi:hypothetical protein ACFPK9_12830 [Rubritalea spongiae]|uniref:Uncharacterized protein n=1 Tax=Rubritalea spongiae TaxID=430797 RepID=A0ABW5E0P9_9BACT